MKTSHAIDYNLYCNPDKSPFFWDGGGGGMHLRSRQCMLRACNVSPMIQCKLAFETIRFPSSLNYSYSNMLITMLSFRTRRPHDTVNGKLNYRNCIAFSVNYKNEIYLSLGLQTKGHDDIILMNVKLFASHMTTMTVQISLQTKPQVQWEYEQ